MVMAFLCTITLFGQQRVPQHVQELVNNKTNFRPVAPLSLSGKVHSPAIDATVSNATFATLNANVVRDIAAKKYEAIELTLPYNNSTVTLQLYRVEVVAKGFHIDTNKDNDIAYTQGAYYRGVVKGDSKSIASFNFFGKEMNGVASSAKLHNLVVGRLKQAGNLNDYIIYSDSNLKAASSFSCAVTDSKELPTFNPANVVRRNTESTRCVTVYFELDYELFVQNGEDTALASNWITSVFNNVQTLYDNDGITTAIKSVFIWTEPDPYSGESSSDYLGQFYYMRPTFDGDIGQLLGIDEGGLGGVAISINGFCSDGNVSYSDVDLWYDDVPMFSWTVQVITHELGHLYGSPHTHGCYWNGNGTSIDGCGTMAGYEEGDCELGPIPDEDVGGTIMSYCHLIGGVGINFANGFGPQPAALILNSVEAASCLSTDCINTCINTVASVTLTDAALDTATLNWEDSTDGPWEVGYAAYGRTITNWNQVTVNTATITGLQANTYYNFGVRPLCNEGQTPEVTNLVFGTAAEWCGGITWTDPLANRNYANNMHLVRIIKPSAAGQAVNVSFTIFDTEPDYDYMYVYDGIGTSAPMLAMLSGSDIADTFTASNADGALTFEFISDEALNAAGWSATVNCTLGTAHNTFANLTYYPNPVNGNITIAAPEGLTGIAVYNVAGQLLLQKKVNSATDITDMSSYAAGIYFFKVTNGENSANIRIVKE